MFREEENHVALFIDWDNLAISTAADFGGAAPDVRAIVRVAQRYGTILLARAYAEWQVPSDRLSVYRSGVDPIYAPTFRFEPDPVNQAPRGKSLADPCLVADCIDTLHLMPNVTHFVLVSGDKDLIPIVRLVQLRGRKVVVIGPDYVAAILRDMADEYVSYRSIVESGEAVATPSDQFAAGAASRRRRAAPPRVSAAPAPAPAPAAQAAQPAQPAQPLRQARPAQPAPQPRPATPEPIAQAPAPAAPAPSRALPFEQAPVVEVAEPSENGGSAAVEEAPAIEVPERREVSPEELKTLLATVDQILHEREAQGKPRLRATNLKDLLMARINGFNERRYGFGKFKDLLTEAEKAGVLELSRTGPVHWVTLPRQREEPAAGEITPAAEAPPAAATQPLPQPQPAPAVPDAQRDTDLIRFVVDLRNRSRWLTYTYVLTNLITHLSQQLGPQSAENEARNALNRLVQEGVLRVDREPREIEVGGARHRVRMCHLEESHPAVQAAIAAEAQAAEESARAEAAAEVAPTAPPAATAEAPAAIASTEQQPARAQEDPSVGLPPLPESLLIPSPAMGSAPLVPPPATPPPAEAPEPAAEATSAETSAPPSTSGPREEGSAAEGSQPPSLAEAFATLREVVRRATGPGKPMAGAASVKTRLGRSLGAFDERTYGFSKFKDFLLAAEREGYVRVDAAGPATRVALPAEG